MSILLSDDEPREWYKIGPYEIASAIGAGGMGEVYRARYAAGHHTRSALDGLAN